MATVDWTAFRDNCLADIARRRQAALELEIHDIMPDFGSYLSDVEANLRYDGDDNEDWQKYQKDPRPFIVDVLLDFGEWNGLDVPPDMYRQAAESAADRYWNPTKYR